MKIAEVIAGLEAGSRKIGKRDAIKAFTVDDELHHRRAGHDDLRVCLYIIASLDRSGALNAKGPGFGHLEAARFAERQRAHRINRFAGRAAHSNRPLPVALAIQVNRFDPVLRRSVGAGVEPGIGAARAERRRRSDQHSRAGDQL